MAELEIKGPLEYLQVQATTLVSLLFIHLIPIDCKITNLPYTCNNSMHAVLIACDCNLRTILRFGRAHGREVLLYR